MTITNIFDGGRRYQVLAAAVIANRPGGQVSYVYKNGILPPDTNLTHVEHLLELGMIREIEGAAQ